MGGEPFLWEGAPTVADFFCSVTLIITHEVYTKRKSLIMFAK